ncbi:hypothetical protein ACFL2T_02050 [Elusimicrobiota bacterium]
MIEDVTTSCTLCGGTGVIFTEGTNSCRYCQCRKQKLPSLLLAAGGIPARYVNSALGNTQPENQVQAAAISRLRHYADTLPERVRAGDGVALLGAGSRIGKTHLACALLGTIAEQYVDALRIEKTPLVFLNTSLFINGWRNYYAKPPTAAEGGGGGQWRQYDNLVRQERSAFDAEFLILDEIGEVTGTEFVGGKLYTLIEHRVSSLLPIIFTSNLTWDGLVRRYGDDGARIVGRLQEITADYTFTL